jgi:DNA-binding CsgD family transcriptional regulator
MSFKKITCLKLWQDSIEKMELQILTLLTYGLSMCEISDLLNMSEDSVYVYLANIIEKFGQF